MSETELRAQFDAFQVEARRVLWALENDPGPGAHFRAAFQIMQAANGALAAIAEDARRPGPA